MPFFMGALIDLTGQVFGKLTVLSLNGMTKDNKALWNCLCDCGNTIIKRGYKLRNGKELYCGDNHPTKVCTQCKLEKNKENDYHKSNKSLNRINPRCKECIAKWYVENSDSIKKKYDNEMQDKDKRANKRAIGKKSWLKNKHKELAYKRVYEKRPEVIKHRNEIHANRKKNDAVYNIKRRLRWRIRDTVKRIIGNGFKYKSSLVLLGCDMDFFKSYLEDKFAHGMNWNNISEWHIDHIKPCSKFDLTDIEEQKKCFHYTNLQPLWWFDNLIKGTKYEEESNLANS